MSRSHLVVTFRGFVSSKFGFGVLLGGFFLTEKGQMDFITNKPPRKGGGVPHIFVEFSP